VYFGGGATVGRRIAFCAFFEEITSVAQLINHQVLASKDLHEMQQLLAEVTNTNKIDVVGKGHDVDALFCAVPINDIKLMHVTYGNVPTRVRAYEHDEDSLMLFLLTAGAAQVRHRGEDFAISPTVALMRDTRAATFADQENFASYALSLSADALKRQARALLGEGSFHRDITFDAKVDLETPGGRHLRQTIDYVASALDGPLRQFDNPLVMNGLRELLLTHVLTLLPNSYSDLLNNRPTGGALPYYVKRARDYIHAHADRPITLETLAQQAGCSYRTLQIAFNDAFEMSPMAYVRFVRLNGAHADLRTAAPGAGVRDIALKWGFSHVGWFSRRYLEQFGVLPSQTLRSRK
tara:strand:- start:346 stop:1398 length:1053 start_codon:yes stop_codon:yes gene_type:complete